MTNDTRSAAEIEREIEDRRARLNADVENLQERFSMDGIFREIGLQFREHGGDVGRAVADQVKSNPVPLALTGIGLAWLMMGKSDRPDPSPSGYSRAEEEYRRYRLARGQAYTPPAGPVYGSPVGGPAWAMEDDDRDHRSVGERVSEKAGHVSDGIADTTSRVSGGVSKAAADAKSGLAETGAHVRDRVDSARSSASDRLEAARQRIADGTEHLSEEGRARVIAAREKALEMRRRASANAERGIETAQDFYDQQPLVVGALALAVGAALGGALPRTQVEDDLMGQQSDDLFDEAERIFEEEKRKAAEVTKAVSDEVKDIASETKSEADDMAPGDRTAAEAAADKVRSAADRVADTARHEAEKRELGTSDS
ncbi:DUF3618 domain-containing protein [Marinibacterium profundimaris]|uniref:DUF3618 domain-containing protein n=1 Tax=Marinibacterium profundimaris TaxID=1679460 RepID=A0A225NBR9_9RHOB|nr:DUF3618 domain-containing protein [Marinibacterium profundimaris]OWU68103.1 hypothetical protein ATO3_24705 [Marinibacterium profundimaris]